MVEIRLDLIEKGKLQGLRDPRELLSRESNELHIQGYLGAGQRVAITTAEGVLNTPRGALNAVDHYIHNPIDIVKTVGGSALLAATLKTVLPEAGPVGKITGGVLGALFIADTAPAFLNSYKTGLNARNWNEMHLAGKQWGDAAGHLAVSSGLGVVGYKLGAGISGRILSSERMDGFADLKQNFWDSATDKTKAILGLRNEIPTGSAIGLKANYQVEGETAKLLDSTQTAPGDKIGPTDPNVDMSATLLLKSKASVLRMDRYIQRMAEGRETALSDVGNAFENKFGAKPESLDAVKTFAEKNNLSVLESDLRSGRVMLSGKSGDFQKAFSVELHDYATADGVVTSHTGAVALPKDLAPHVRAVFGVDQRIAASSNYKVQVLPEEIAAAEANQAGNNPVSHDEFMKLGGYRATDIAHAQNIPLRTGGEGQHGAFISVGGGIDLKDYNLFFAKQGLEQPKPLKIIEVDGAKNTPGNPHAGDIENALDGLQLQSMAPKAEISMILGPNNNKGLVDVFERGIFPRNGEAQNTVISASWGLAEHKQTTQVVNALSIAFRQAAIRGVQVFAGAGDNGARSISPTYQPEFPASDPNVVGVGGLKTVLNNEGKFASVSAWNEGESSSTGGGVSKIFRLPRWQRDVGVPPNLDTGKVGRGVPDISTNAAKATGYPVRVGGEDIVIGGTSAGAPLYAGMMLNLNAELAMVNIKPITPLNPWMYARAKSGMFNDVTVGSNHGYFSKEGWDPVTGLGWVDGLKMLDAMKADQTTNFGKVIPFMPPVSNLQPFDRKAASVQ